MFGASTKVKTPPKRPPLTQGLPVVGSLPLLIRNPFGYLKQAHETYGDMYYLNLGLSKMLILNHPRQVQHVFVDNVQNYRKGGEMWEAGCHNDLIFDHFLVHIPKFAHKLKGRK